ncbi:MAG: hypothetical protein AAGA99_16160 [Actinomycetota bacterium]
MPDMPLPTSRPVALIALEAAISDLVVTPSSRRALSESASSWDADAFSTATTAEEAAASGLFAALSANHPEIREALIAMARGDVRGRLAKKSDDRIDSVLLDSAIRHMDWEWLSPQNRSGFWLGWTGSPGPIIRHMFQVITAYEDPQSVQLMWVCGSPTFEVSISENAHRGLCVVLSTPGPDLPLVHIADEQPANPKPTDATDHEDHLVIYGPAVRTADGEIEQRSFLVAQPSASASSALPDELGTQVEARNTRLRNAQATAVADG